MKIIFLTRKFNKMEISFEKLFKLLYKDFRTKGVDVVKLENPYGSGIINLLKSIIFFRKTINSTDVVHITGQIHFAAIALRTEKIIITVHDLGLYRQLSNFRLFIFKIFWIYLPFKRARYIVAISNKTKQEIVSLMPSVSNKVIVIHNCLTVEIENEYSKHYEKHNSILIVGTRSNKNLVRSLKALESLDVEVTIIGELNCQLKTMIKDYNLRCNNYSNLSEEDLRKFYKESNILLFPSTYEGFGLPILEAQATNTLVVTSNIAPMNEIGKTSILVNPYSICSIREGVMKALSFTEEQRSVMINSGRDNLKKFTVDNISNKYLELYNSFSN